MSLVVALVVLALPLVALGRWGRYNADSLVPGHIRGAERERRVQVLRRGSATCHLIAAVFVVLAVFTALQT